MSRLCISFIFILLLSFVVNAQDWPDLKHYQAANDSLSLPDDDEFRVVFMGNSITESWSLVQPDFFKDKPYINRGISGQTTPQMLLRFRQDVIQLQPGAVVILAGTNDIAGNTGPVSLEMIQNNIISMAELAKANGIEVVLAALLPAKDFAWAEGKRPDEKIPLLNKWIEQYAAEKDFIFLDFFTDLADEENGLPASYSSDGVHPNKTCYEVMAVLAEKAVQQAHERFKNRE